jgi:hypothetical protein
MEHYVPRNDLDKWNKDLYDPQLMDGLPIALQVIGRRFQEEKVLGVANVLEELVVSQRQGEQCGFPSQTTSACIV